MKKFILMSFALLLLSFTTVSAYDPVVINTFDIKMVVDENGLIKVDQTLDVQFNEDRHGIYAYIPQSYNMVWTIDNQEIEKSYYFPVRNVQVFGDDYEYETDGYDNVVLKIGDEDRTIYGQKTYHYSYTIQLRDLDLEGRQIFYQNLVGDGWQIPINNVTFSITLPKSWPSDIQFYSGLYGNDDVANVNYDVVGNVLSGSYNEPLLTYQALTIYVPLPNDYFTFIPPTDYSVLILGLSIGLLLLAFVLFLRFGKDDIVVETVEFNPIPGLSSAQVGFVYDGMVDSKDIISLIIEWGYKGYLSITETEGTKDFTLTKLKEIDLSEIKAEQTLFHQLFKTGEIVSSDTLKNTFYIAMQNAKNDVYRYFQGNPKRHIYSNTATFLKVLFGSLGLIPLALLFANYYYMLSYRGIVSFVIAGVIFLFGSSLGAWLIYSVKRWPSQKSYLRMLNAVFLFILFALFTFGSFTVSYFILIPVWQYALVLLLTLILLGLVSVMDKRTELGITYLGKILGLKRFIEVAEKDRLEMMVKDDPTYFYKILPYAYVLNVSDVWSKKFESIAIEQPSWYSGPNTHFNTFIFMNSFNHTLSNMNQVMTSIPQRSGTGGGGFGGGGGGFSGGGFGGGGGGSW
ncbi:MAG TPA: DUF2207 domain-containing protein [Erysipelotrichaceae bacterium]|nr:DUF2207 domain-containing protein [Erysipelotrichaceae bacterium]